MFTLHNGDGMKIIKGLNLPSDTRFILDPPYGSNAYKTDKEIPPSFYRWMLDNFQTVAFFGYPENLVDICVKIKAVPNEWVTWAGSNRLGGLAKYLPRVTECIAIFGDIPGAKNVKRPRAHHTFGRALALKRGLSLDWAQERDTWQDPSPGWSNNNHLRQHTNEKPESLMRKLVILCSNEGDLIVDPFMGSGTTGVSSLQLGRSFIGCEIVKEHFETAERRISQAVLQPSLFTPSNNRLHLTGGIVPAQGDLFTPEDLPSEGKLPAPAPRR